MMIKAFEKKAQSGFPEPSKSKPMALLQGSCSKMQAHGCSSRLFNKFFSKFESSEDEAPAGFVKDSSRKIMESIKGLGRGPSEDEAPARFAKTK